jgi:CRISPR type III-A-associated protein Csm2
MAEVEEKKGEERRGGDNRPGRDNRGGGGPRPAGDRGSDRGAERGSGDRGGDRGRDQRGGGGFRPGGERRGEGPPEIELDKLISDSLYLDNQAHVVVSRMRDMDSGTKSQLRRLYNAVRRATRAPENERQHEFVMVRARLAYTIARHSLRSLDALERLLLQVTRKNETRGYERFRDLFEAIIAYNE